MRTKSTLRARFHIAVTFTIALFIVGVGIASAQEVEESEPIQAFRTTEQRAKSGDSDAQLLLAHIYLGGDGVERNPSEGEYWLKRAAENGNHEAEYEYGVYNGRKGDWTEAYRWSLKAAQAGLVGAQMDVSYLYHNGLGVGRDIAQAIFWNQKAADQGNPDAMVNIGLLYETGEGVPQDSQQAIKWYMRAAELRSDRAEFGIGTLYARGLGIEKDLAKAFDWFLLAHRHGNVRASYNLARMLIAGEGVKKNVDAGLEYLETALTRATAATTKDSPLISAIALLYVAPDVPKEQQNPELARFLLRPLAEQGDTGAILRLGRLEEFAGNHADAVQWFTKGAEHGDALSVLALATHFHEGKGVAKDEEKAAQLFKRATELEDSALILNDAAYFFATVSNPKLKNPELALKLALRAVSLDGDKAEFLDTLAEAYYCNNDFAQAVTVEERALKLAPDNKVIQNGLSRFKTAFLNAARKSNE